MWPEAMPAHVEILLLWNEDDSRTTAHTQRCVCVFRMIDSLTYLCRSCTHTHKQITYGVRAHMQFIRVHIKSSFTVCRRETTKWKSRDTIITSIYGSFCSDCNIVCTGAVIEFDLVSMWLHRSDGGWWMRWTEKERKSNDCVCDPCDKQ